MNYYEITKVFTYQIALIVVYDHIVFRNVVMSNTTAMHVFGLNNLNENSMSPRKNLKNHFG